jgi:predicted Rossmann fold flavoprotein
VNAALAAFPVNKTLQWFRDLGLYTVAEESGRVYPYSDQANSVVDVLRFGLQKDNIQLLTGFEVTRVRKDAEGFLVESKDGKYRCDRLIIACGGLAGTKLGGSMSGYQLLRSFGHRVTKLRPALVQVKSNWGGCVSLKGVRTNCHAAIYHEDVLHSQSTGELQFTEYGLSGPVMFEITRDVCQKSGNWTCKLDFLPQAEEAELLTELQRRTQRELPAEELLTGIVHNRLGKVLIKAAGVSAQMMVKELTLQQLTDICAKVKAFEVPLTETLGMDSAQVTAGGVVTADFDPQTMQSKLVPGLYACGEVLDVDGDCGGYNLQWAWSSGMAAGLHAGGRV